MHAKLKVKRHKKGMAPHQSSLYNL